MPRTSKVWLSQEQQDDFERFARSRTLAARLVQRSQILLMAAAHKLGMAEELSRGLARAQCFNGATEFAQITHFYPTVKLRVRLLSRYSRAVETGALNRVPPGISE